METLHPGEPRARGRQTGAGLLRSPLVWGIVLALAGVMAIGWAWSGGRSSNSIVVDWRCSNCQHGFRAAIPLRVADQLTTMCPKCGQKTGRRVQQGLCRGCGKRFEVQLKRNVMGASCPFCKSTNVVPVAKD